MTRYQEVQSEKNESTRNEKESKRLAEMKAMISNLYVFMDKSPRVEGIIHTLKTKGVEGDLRAMAMRKVIPLVEKTYAPFQRRDYRNTPYYDVYPTADIIITNSPEAFAHLIDTNKSRELECTGTAFGSSTYEYKQYAWEPVLNDDIEVISYGKEYEAFHSVDFNVNEPYLLFGWKNKWREDEYRSDAFKEVDGKQVETLHTTRFTSDPEIICYSVLVYVPDTDKEFYKKTISMRDFIKAHTPRPPGFFARLFGK